MNATEVSQIVHDPRHPDQSEELLGRLRKLADSEPPIRLKSHFKLSLGEVLHPLGVHTWVRHKTLDSDHLIDVGLVCWFCPKGKRG